MSVRLRSVLLSVFAAMLLFAGLLRVPVVRAATFNVNTNLDLAHTSPINGNCTPCSLRSAIQAANFLTANGDPGPHTINLPADTYLLTLPVASGGGALPITGNIVLAGAGASTTIIDGNNLYAVFNATAGTTNIANVTIQHGNAIGSDGVFFGGGLNNGFGAAVTLDHVVITNNFASSSGGGLSNNSGGTLTVRNSMVVNNRAGGAGGIFNFKPPGAGVSTLTLENTTVANNTITGSSGLDGINLVAQAGGVATTTITNSTITGHRTSISNTGTLTLTSSTVSATVSPLNTSGPTTI
jgi:hypothetical protein